MNWYNLLQLIWEKKAQVLEEDPIVEDTNKPDYNFIGHYNRNLPDNQQPKTFIWLYNGSSIQNEGPVQITKNNQISHESIWGEGIADSSYHGRYEPATGRLSAIVPYHSKQLPSFLIDELKWNYHPSKIYVYY